jgi:AcrR family transcriptional regulator
LTGSDEGGVRRRRPLRADARRNEDRLLVAAAVAFANDGANASVRDIARAAGVGIGTLYRRFPSKELLIEATYQHEVQSLCAAAPELAESLAPAEALREWMGRFVDFMATKQAMSDALRTVLTDDSDRLETREHLGEAIECLLAVCRDHGMARAGVGAQDVLMVLGGISFMSDVEQRPDLAEKLIDLLLYGVLDKDTPIEEPEAATASTSQG